MRKKNSITEWIDYRLPIFSLWKKLINSPTPKNLNLWWTFGSILGLALLIQIITGIFLSVHYIPHVEHAFTSIQQIMRNVNYGWLLRYSHSVGASLLFFVMYIHILRNMYYGSYKSPRELVWQMGIVIFILMVITAFTGFVLPWGQMSYWGTTVITNIFSVLPWGDKIVHWIWGGMTISTPTLNRFFTLHYLIPLIIVLIFVLHLIALRVHGSSNPQGIELHKERDYISFHPYYTIKDFLGFVLYLLVFALFVFYCPDIGSIENQVEADPLVTPAHIVPEWYLLPFYAILRAIPNKLWGVLAMNASLLVLFFLPWLDYSHVQSARHRPVFKIAFWIFTAVCIILGYLGARQPDGVYLLLARLATCYYFMHFLLLLPIIAKYEQPLPLPSDI